MYASWDGEEPGLLGSTEWAETHAEELQQKAVLYINTDNNSRGFLGAGGSHSLQTSSTRWRPDVTDPETHVSVQTRVRAHLLVAAATRTPEDETQGDGEDRRRRAATCRSTRWVPAPTTPRSSTTSGIASLDLGFCGEGDGGGIYHSLYDSWDHYNRFGDPGFKYGVALAQVAGHMVLRIADADVLPMRFGDFADTLDRYVGELHKLVDATKKDTEAQHKLLAMHAYELDSDPARPVGPPARDSDVPGIDLKPLDDSAKKLKSSAQAYEAAYDARAAKGLRIPAGQLQQINELMASMEQRLTDPNGLPGREWFKHMIYAPGMLTGYGVKTLPGVREALDARRWDEADQYAAITAKVLDGYRAQLDKLTAMLK